MGHAIKGSPLTASEDFMVAANYGIFSHAV
jgi:hypothetical protein